MIEQYIKGNLPLARFTGIHVNLDEISFTWVCARQWRSLTQRATVPQIQSRT